MRGVANGTDKEAKGLSNEDRAQREGVLFELRTKRCQIGLGTGCYLQIELGAASRSHDGERSGSRRRHRFRALDGRGRCFDDDRRRDDGGASFLGSDASDRAASEVRKAGDEAHHQRHAHHDGDELAIGQREFVAGGLRVG